MLITYEVEAKGSKKEFSRQRHEHEPTHEFCVVQFYGDPHITGEELSVQETFVDQQAAIKHCKKLSSRSNEKLFLVVPITEKKKEKLVTWTEAYALETEAQILKEALAKFISPYLQQLEEAKKPIDQLKKLEADIEKKIKKNQKSYEEWQIKQRNT